MNPLLAFLQELFIRFTSKSPVFAKIIQGIAALVAAITGLPDFLTMFAIQLPPALTVFENKTIAIAATTAAILAQLHVKDTTGLPLTNPQPAKS